MGRGDQVRLQACADPVAFHFILQPQKGPFFQLSNRAGNLAVNKKAFSKKSRCLPCSLFE